MFNWKFWKGIPPETQQEIEALRAKVAEYAAQILELQERHEMTMKMWSRHTRILLGLECEKCGANLIAWREEMHEEHHCPDAKIDVKALLESCL